MWRNGRLSRWVAPLVALAILGGSVETQAGQREQKFDRRGSLLDKRVQ